MYVNEYEGAHTQSIHNLSTRSHPSEGENRTRNRSKNCKCERAYRASARFAEYATSNPA